MRQGQAPLNDIRPMKILRLVVQRQGYGEDVGRLSQYVRGSCSHGR